MVNNTTKHPLVDKPLNFRALSCLPVEREVKPTHCFANQGGFFAPATRCHPPARGRSRGAEECSTRPALSGTPVRRPLPRCGVSLKGEVIPDRSFQTVGDACPYKIIGDGLFFKGEVIRDQCSRGVVAPPPTAGWGLVFKR